MLKVFKLVTITVFDNEFSKEVLDTYSDQLLDDKYRRKLGTVAIPYTVSLVGVVSTCFDTTVPLIYRPAQVGVETQDFVKQNKKLNQHGTNIEFYTHLKL